MIKLAVAAVVGIAMSIGLTGCATPGTDTISPTAGNAVHHNRVVHAVDPWPPHAWQVKIGSSGARARQAVDQLEGRGSSDRGTQGQAPAPEAAETQG